MDEWLIEPLQRKHERDKFSCREPSLDQFLPTLVNQYEKRKLGRTYVALLHSGKRVCGYYTLASSSVPFAQLPASAARKLPKHPVPVILLARLAIDESVQGQGLGKLLLVDALKRCRDLSQRLGVHAVEVQAIDEPAKDFYLKYGFVP